MPSSAAAIVPAFLFLPPTTEAERAAGAMLDETTCESRLCVRIALHSCMLLARA
eukprot:CAMPEP_0119345138 /NCGR_PEP_ID=MMETSP1333-20130426/107329_1 /TAXON_ID=418940 /ORGANISM="Scyphosphaera apsteinii, Strain RCC1455" /LENGTH=53 /DNA_ID=CAMNT_0007357591 /DNA_START=661 /DNA_END=822 /DNA_ORIENTATION=+